MRFVFFLISLSTLSQNSYYKQLGVQVGVIKEQGYIGDLLTEGWYKNNNPKERLKLIDKAFTQTKIKKDSTLLPYIYFHYANFYLLQNDNIKSLYYLEKSKKIIDWKSNNYLLSRIYNYTAYIYQIENKNDKAIENYEIILKNSEFDFPKNLANTNMVTIYMEAKKYKLAKTFIDNVYNYYCNIIKKPNNVNMAFIYQYLSFYEENKDKKLKLINRGIELVKNRPIYNQVTAINYRAEYYLNNNEYNLAINDFNTTIHLVKKNKLTFQINDSYMSLANAYLKLKDYKNALMYVDSANINIKNGNLYFKKNLASIKYKSYEKLKDYKNAYTYTKEYINFNDSIQLKNKDSLYIAYGKKYQTEQKIQENELLKKEGIIKDLEVTKQKTTRNLLIGLSVIILFSLLLLYNRFLLKQKAAKKLKGQNDIISQQKVALEIANRNKQKLFSIVAHDLINPFNAILGYTKLLNDDYNGFTEKEKQEFIQTIHKYATNNYDLTKTLLDWARIQQEGLVVKKEVLNCREVVNTAIKPFLILADKKQIQVNLHILENTTVEADNNMMQTVIGNLFVNAVKFTPKKGEINLNLTKLENGTIQLEIADNGIGMSQEQLNNLFDISKVNTRKGTENEKGNGLGLVLCKELMTMQNGTLNFFSTLNTGSKAVITV